jgi:hypothetical protein
MGDVCLDETNRYGRQESYKLSHLDGVLPAVDPPYQSYEEEKRRAIDPDGNVASHASVIADTLKEPPANPSDLNASIAKAKELVAYVSDSNRKRRAAIGIKAKENVAVQMLRVPEVVGGKEPEEVASPKQPTVENDGMEKAADIESDNNEIDEEGPSMASRLRKQILSFLFVLMLAQMAYGVYHLGSHYVFGPTVSSGNETKFANESKSAPVEVMQHDCFIDHPADFFSPDETVNDQVCAGKFLPCPQWGRCHGGILRDCDDAGNVFDGVVRFVLNSNGDGCIPTTEVLEIVSIVKDALAVMTVSQHCNMWNRLGKGDVLGSSEGQLYPLFRIEKVVEFLGSHLEEGTFISNKKVVETLLWLEPVDSSVLRYGSFAANGEEMDAIGLANDVSTNSLPFPLICSVRTVSWELFMLSFTIFGYLAKMSWHYIYNFPYLSVLVMVLAYIVNLFMKRKRRLEKIREIFPQVMEITYDRLAEVDNNEGYAALMLRDDIGRDMYPTQLKKREFFFNEVWPRVVADIHSDNRVRKFRKEANGKNLEHWDLHKQPKQGRRLRKFLGTSAPKLDAVVNEQAPAGRDP